MPESTRPLSMGRPGHAPAAVILSVLLFWLEVPPRDDLPSPVSTQAHGDAGSTPPITAPITERGQTGAQIIDGLALSKKYREHIAQRVQTLRAAGHTVRLDAVLVESGDNGARVYAENQAKTCGQLGIDYTLHRLDASSTEVQICAKVQSLSDDPSVHAVMLHVPLPANVDVYSVQRLIDLDKDVEGVNPANIGNIVYGRSSLAPCTALAVVKMMESVFDLEPNAKPDFSRVPGAGLLRGKVAVVVGAGDVVGKPIAVLLMRHEATVISCNKFTPALPELARTADVLVAAAGVPALITGEMIKPGAIVVDVGVNRVTGADGKTKTVGDVSFEAAARVAGYISPVPGGVGPMTVSMLLMNVVEAAERAVRKTSM